MEVHESLGTHENLEMLGVHASLIKACGNVGNFMKSLEFIEACGDVRIIVEVHRIMWNVGFMEVHEFLGTHRILWQCWEFMEVMKSWGFIESCEVLGSHGSLGISYHQGSSTIHLQSSILIHDQ